MNRRFIAVAAAIVAFTGTLAAQAIMVVGTGDPNVDVPAVQAAVDQGGWVVLKGHFSFDAPPTVPEQPAGPEFGVGGVVFGMVLVSKAVAISGTRDEQGEMTSIQDGTNPFYVEAPGAPVTIQGLHFIHSKYVAIRVVAASGLVIASNTMDGSISIATSPGPPSASQPGRPENVSGTLFIVNNNIDFQGTAGADIFGIAVFGLGRSPDQEVDLHISGNSIRNATERPINIFAVGGRAYIERNVIKTGSFGINVKPSGDAIHIVGPGSFLVARNSIDCAWASGLQAGIRLQTRALDGQAVSHAVVVDNDVNMSAPEGTAFGVTSAAIEIRGAGEGNMVLNNRIRGRANFALSVAAQDGVPLNTTFIMNDLQGFTSAQADLFVDAGATNTIAVGRQRTVEDHGSGTVIVPVR